MKDSARTTPHVVWIMCDQLRADAVGFMGNRIVRTPHLDRLASRGVVFENMYVQSPVCMTSRACIWTSRYLRNLGMANGCPVLDPRETTLTELLQRVGYHTGLFGKLHLTPQQFAAETLKADRPISDAKPFLEATGYPPIPDDPAKRNYGFQTVVPFEDTVALGGAYRDWLAQRDRDLAARVKHYHQQCWRSEFPVMSRAVKDSNPLNTADQLTDVGASDIPVALHPSVFLAESATAFFTANHRQSPCLVNLSFVDPHHPFDPPREMAARYKPADMPLPKHANPGNIAWPAALAARMGDYSSVTTPR